MSTLSRMTTEGTKDLLFEQCRNLREVERRLSRIFDSSGYQEVQTPGVEYYDVFRLQGASLPQQEMYKTTDNNGRLVVFRPDSTLPIARMTAARLQSQTPPLRLYYNQSIYRNRPDLTGQYNEYAQMGIELLGVSGMRADLEAITLAVAALDACAADYRIEIGHAGLFQALSEQLPLSEARREEIRAIIESKNYAALSAQLEGLRQTDAVLALQVLPRLFGGAEAIDEARRYCRDDKTAGILSYLESLYQTLSRMGLQSKIMVDLGLVQRNDYYTGVVFSAYLESFGNAVLMGGRYDNLLEKFGAPMPAIGFSVETGALAEVAPLPVRGGQSATEVLIMAETGYEAEAYKYMKGCIAAGHRCENSLFDTWADTLACARAMGIPKAVRVGRERETVSLADTGGAG